MQTENRDILRANFYNSNLHLLIWPLGGSNTSFNHHIDWVLSLYVAEMENILAKTLFTHSADMEQH